MSAPALSHPTAGRALAAMLLSFVLGTSVAQPASGNGVAPGKMNASPAASGGAPVSPHARAARQRAAAQAQADAQAAQSGIRVSPFTNRRKPHNVAGGR